MLGVKETFLGAAMPKGPQEDTGADDGKDKAAKALGKKGGKARAAGLTAKRRTEIARKAAAARWQKEPGGPRR
jgi:hypothetical protein